MFCMEAIVKKRIAIIVLIVAALSTVGIVTAVAADAPTGLVQAVRGAIGRGGWGPLQGVAEFLGLTPQQMQQARADGKTVADLAVEQGKDLGQLVDSVINTRPPSMAEQIAEAVANGSITQEQADQQLANLKDRLTGTFSGELPEGRGSAIGRGGLDWDALSATLGLSPEDIRTALADGATVAELIAQQGLEQDALVETLSAAMSERLAQAVAEGKLTQEQADTQLAAWQERLAGILSGDTPWPIDGRASERAGMMAPRGGFATEALSEALGMTVEQVRTALADGQTVAELIAQQGLEIDTVVDALFAPEAERLAQAVTDGKITQEQSDALMALHKASLVERLSGTAQGPLGEGELARPQGMPGGRGGRR
jgi:sulfur carrier protein ThiS